ncbi:MAG: ABC transporter substrate-binding protein [Parvibaculaceae bacterium]
MSKNSSVHRRLALAAALALSVMVAPGPWAPQPARAAATCPEAQTADAAGAAFLNAGKSASASAFASALRAHTDMNQITMFALGKYRSQLDSGRQAELVNLTSSYVATTLADFALKFRGSAIKAIECRGGTVVSRMEFLGKPAKRVQWRISGGKVTDVNIQNVWLAQLLRDNFNTIITQGGGKVDALYAKLGGGRGKSGVEVGNK